MCLSDRLSDLLLVHRLCLQDAAPNMRSLDSLSPRFSRCLQIRAEEKRHQAFRDADHDLRLMGGQRGWRDGCW